MNGSYNAALPEGFVAARIFLSCVFISECQWNVNAPTILNIELNADQF
jgi:hypothetical protein